MMSTSYTTHPKQRPPERQSLQAGSCVDELSVAVFWVGC